MTYADDHNDISTFEDLEPEPRSSQKEKQSRLRELILGVVLLAAVLAFAGWQWWSTEAARSHYEEGQWDASHMEWNSALADFSQAPGYKDADTLAADIRKKIAERDKQYRVADAAMGLDNVFDVLAAARAVQTIQPDYKDIKSIASQAEDLLYRDAVSGTIAMRLDADPPGLYYRAAHEWQWLKSSDIYSSMLNYSGNCFVYDVPGPGWTPSAGSTPTPSMNVQAGNPEKLGRKAMVAEVDASSGALKPTALSFDPAYYNSFICGGTTVWGYRYDENRQSNEIPALNYVGLGTLAYQEIGTTITSTIQLLGAEAGTASGIADIGKSGKHLAAVTYISVPGSKPVSEVYITGPNGSDARKVYTTSGVPRSVLLSPSERYLFVASFDPPPADLQGNSYYQPSMTAMLFDLESEAPPSVIAHSTAGIYILPGDHPEDMSGYFQIQGVFLSRGLLRDKLVTSQVDNGSLKVQLIDPSNPSAPLVSTNWGVTDSVLTVSEQADGRTIFLDGLNYQMSSAGNIQPNTGIPTLMMQLPPQGALGEVASSAITTTFTLPLISNSSKGGNSTYLHSLYLLNGQLVYQLSSSRPSIQGTNVYTIPWEDGLSEKDKPKQLIGAEWDYDTERTSPLSWFPGNTTLAYTDKSRTLHVRAVNSDADVVLEHGITIEYSLNQPFGLLYLR